MRHILTPEETARGHRLTLEDRRKGGRNVPRATRGGKPRPEHIAKLIELGAPYRLTSERARELAKLSAQVRRERRAAALARLELGKREATMPSEGLIVSSPEQNKRLTEIYLGGQERIELTMAEVAKMESTKDARALGASLAGKLMEGTNPDPSSFVLTTVGPPSEPIDPFTLSALKRFRLGPRSPLELTRSQRAHVEIMREQGFLAVTGDSMLALTEKGRQAVEGSEASDG